VDRTEVVQSSLHLVFSKVFTLEYYFEEVQKLRFEVYDTHGPSSLSYQDDDLLGGMEYTLGQIVAQKKPRRSPSARVIAGDISGNNGHAELSLHARKLGDTAQWDYVSLKYTQKKRSSKNSGVVILADPKRSRPEALASVFPGCGCRTFYRVYSFRDYIVGGCQIHFTQYYILLILTDGVVANTADTQLPVPWTHTHSFNGDPGLPSCLSRFALCPEQGHTGPEGPTCATRSASADGLPSDRGLI
ncbi:hypothetical protein E2I00_013556, partial [Balaenoptera physalus]